MHTSTKMNIEDPLYFYFLSLKALRYLTVHIYFLLFTLIFFMQVKKNKQNNQTVFFPVSLS